MRLSSLVMALAALVTCSLAASAQTPTKIRFSTDGGPSGRHAYFFVAKEKGYFSAEGLDVEIIGGRGSASVIKEVAAGSIDIGFADAGTSCSHAPRRTFRSNLWPSSIVARHML